LPFPAIKLEWGLFEGGRRVAEVRVADSRIREAVAEPESIADTIAFQDNQAYRQLVAARKGIDRSRPAVEPARETYRLVVAQSRQGDATPAELTEAEAGLTRAEQDYANSVYDYLTAIERMQYAMGTTATPLTPGCHWSLPAWHERFPASGTARPTGRPSPASWSATRLGPPAKLLHRPHQVGRSDPIVVEEAHELGQAGRIKPLGVQRRDSAGRAQPTMACSNTDGV